MNFVEALKTGRPIHNKNHNPNFWFRIAGGFIESCHERDDGKLISSRIDVTSMPIEIFLADGWEAKEPTVTITRSQLIEAQEKLFIWNVSQAQWDEYLDQVTKKLGFE